MQEWSKSQTGLEQYAINKFAEAFEVVPRTLAENSGLNATDVVSTLYAAHTQGQATAGATRIENSLAKSPGLMLQCAPFL